MTYTLNEAQMHTLVGIVKSGSSQAASDIGELLGREVGISVPRAIATSLSDAIDTLGSPGDEVVAVTIGVTGIFDAALVVITTPAQAAVLCEIVGMEWGTEMGMSLMAELGNMLGCAYAFALANTLGLEIEVLPPSATQDMLGALVMSLAAVITRDSDSVLLIDSQLQVSDCDAALSVVFVPESEGIRSVLSQIGL